MKQILSIALLMALCAAGFSLEYLPDGSGNWEAEGKVSLYLNLNAPGDEADRLAEFLFRCDGARAVAAYYAPRWSIPEEQIFGFAFSMLEPEIISLQGSNRLNRLDYTVGLYLDLDNWMELEQNFRFEGDVRYLYSSFKRIADDTYAQLTQGGISIIGSVEQQSAADAVSALHYYIEALDDGLHNYLYLAGDSCDLAAARLPGFVENAYLHGVLEYMKENYDKAEAFFIDSAAGGDGGVPQLVYRALIDHAQGKSGTGAWMAKAEGASTGSEIELLFLANAFRILDMQEKSMSYFRSARENYPANYLPHMMVGEYHYNMEEFSRAKELFQLALEKGGDYIPAAGQLRNVIANLEAAGY